MYERIISAIRQSGEQEIIALFQTRADAEEKLHSLQEALKVCSPLQSSNVHSSIKEQQKVMNTVDGYLRGNLIPICRAHGTVIYAFSGLQPFIEMVGVAPGDLDTTDDGLTYVNP